MAARSWLGILRNGGDECCTWTGMKLFSGGRAPNPRRVAIFLAEKGLEVETIELDINKLEQRSPEFAALNPMMTLPVLVLEDGTVIAETVAICRYLEELIPEPPLIGVDALDERALSRCGSGASNCSFMLPVSFAFRHLHPGGAHLEGAQIAEWGEVGQRGRASSWNFSIRNWAAGRSSPASASPSPTSPRSLPIRFLRAGRIEPPQDLAHLQSWDGDGGGAAECRHPTSEMTVSACGDRALRTAHRARAASASSSRRASRCRTSRGRWRCFRRRRGSPSAARRRARGFTPVRHPVYRSVRRPAARMDECRRARNSTTRRASPSCRWASAFRGSTPRAATCRRGANARRPGATEFFAAMPQIELMLAGRPLCAKMASWVARRAVLTETVAPGRKLLDERDVTADAAAAASVLAQQWLD